MKFLAFSACEPEQNLRLLDRGKDVGKDVGSKEWRSGCTAYKGGGKNNVKRSLHTWWGAMPSIIPLKCPLKNFIVKYDTNKQAANPTCLVRTPSRNSLDVM